MCGGGGGCGGFVRRQRARSYAVVGCCHALVIGGWGFGDWGGGGDLGYPVPVAASAIERIFAVGIEGWMGVPPMTSTRKAC